MEIFTLKDFAQETKAALELVVQMNLHVKQFAAMHTEMDIAMEGWCALALKQISTAADHAINCFHN